MFSRSTVRASAWRVDRPRLRDARPRSAAADRITRQSAGRDKGEGVTDTFSRRGET